MEWFHVWWSGLGLTGQVMACAAIPMTIVMFLQLILMIIGVGFSGDSDSDFDSDSADADVDVDTDYDVDSGAGIDYDIDTDTDADFDADTGIDFDAHADIDVGYHIDYAGNTEAVSHGFAHGHGSARILTVRGIVAFFAIGGWAGLAALTAGIRPLWSIQISLLSGVAAMLVASIVIRFALRMQSSGNLILGNAVSQIAEVYITIPPLRANTGKITMVLQERFVELDAVTDNLEAIRPHTKVEVIDTAGRDCLVVRLVSNEEEDGK